MKENILRQRRALRRAIARSVVVVAMCAFTSPFAVSAQATAKPATQSKMKSPPFLFAAQAQYGALLDGAFGGSLLIPTKPWRCEDGLCGADGVEFQALAGVGGWRVAGGVGLAALPFWADALVTATRTASSPHGGSPESTYLGGEGSFSFPVALFDKTFVGVRSSIGFAARVQGKGESSNRVMKTWSVGATVLLPNWPF
jgi:hypothetical protein